MVNYRLLRCGASAAVLLAGMLYAGGTPAVAQFGGPAPNPQADAAAKAAPTPKTADGHPDLTGFWGTPAQALGDVSQKLSPDGKTISFGIDDPKDILAKRAAGAAAGGGSPNAAGGGAPNPNPAGGGEGGRGGGRGGRGSQPQYKPELQAKIKDLHDHTTDVDTNYFCLPDGVPRMGPPSEIFQSPNAVAFLYESKNLARVIPTDGRPHDKTADYSFMGDSVGHWEGDTLVVDVDHLTDVTWFTGESGWFHTQDLHVVERLTRQGNTILYEVTVEDPNVLVKPWVMTPRTLRLGKPTEHMAEDPPCYDQSQPHMIDKYHINP